LLKGLFGIVSTFVSITYVIGFILDAAFLEQFGFAHFELIGNALDYLAIGGIYLMFNFAKHFVYIGIFTAVVGIAYHPVKVKCNREFINKYINVDGVPYVLLGAIPLLFVVLLPVVTDAKSLADQFKNAKASEKICIAGNSECFTGRVLRYRESKVVFISKDKESYNLAKVIPEKRVVSIQKL